MTHMTLLHSLKGAIAVLVAAVYSWIIIRFAKYHSWPAMWHLIVALVLLGVGLGIDGFLDAMPPKVALRIDYVTDLMIAFGLLLAAYSAVSTLCDFTHICDLVWDKTKEIIKAVRNGR